MKILLRLSIVSIIVFLFVFPSKATANSSGFLKDGNTYSYFSIYRGADFLQKDAGINNAGQIVGNYYLQGLLIDGGTATSFKYPGSIDTFANGINDASKIVGTYHGGQYSWEYNAHGFIKDGDTMISFDHPNAVYTYSSPNYPNITFFNAYTYAFDINNKDQIVGYYYEVVGNSLQAHGYLKDGNVFNTFDYPGAINTYAFGLNDAGEVVGHYTDANWHHHGFLYADGNFASLDYPNAGDTYAFDINNAGQLVGYYTTANSNYGFMMEGSTFTSFDVPSLSPPIEVLGTFPGGINDNGKIVGVYEYHVSEPFTLLLLGYALVGLFGFRRNFSK